ncbi:MAG: KOW domain-containing RNA-binding protein [Lachnospiraceae bacterium]|nr:KOW domain-containing RNA-binding protein [Lachnospiraceae bacterium]
MNCTEGMIAISLLGHDKGSFYIITKACDECVYLADGRIRKLARPKRKNIKHIQLVKTIPDVIAEKLKNGALTDADVIYALRTWRTANV